MTEVVRTDQYGHVWRASTGHEANYHGPEQVHGLSVASLPRCRCGHDFLDGSNWHLNCPREQPMRDVSKMLDGLLSVFGPPAGRHRPIEVDDGYVCAYHGDDCSFIRRFNRKAMAKAMGKVMKT